MQQYIEFLTSEWPLFLALAVIVGLLVRAFLTGVKGVAPMQAVALMNHEDALIVDVRTDKEFEEGHISNALHIPLGVLSDRLGELKEHKNSTVIIACRSGARSSQAASTLLKQGFEKVHNLSGGMLAWSNANLPVSKGSDKRKKKSAKKNKAQNKDQSNEQNQEQKQSD